MQKQPTKTDVCERGCGSPEGGLLPSLGEGVVRDGVGKMLSTGGWTETSWAKHSGRMMTRVANTVAGIFLNTLTKLTRLHSKATQQASNACRPHFTERKLRHRA